VLKVKAKIKRGPETQEGKALQVFDKIAKTAPQARVGFPASEVGGIKTEDGIPLIAIAVWNEYGTDWIPQRPFLRGTMIIHKHAYRRALRTIAKKGIAGENIVKLLNQLAVVAVGDVKEAILDLQTPPNAPSTIARKDSENPLIDTGLMMQSVTYELRKSGRNGKGKRD
jgi:hypothetical protein